MVSTNIRALTRHPGSIVLFCLSLLVMAGCGGSPGGSTSQSGASNSEHIAQKTAVWTHHNDNFRSGLNLTETVLTPANVRPSTFGKLATFPVQGHVYAQPLYIPDVYMAGGHTSDLLIVATEHDQLYAFDVNAKTVAWHIDYLASGSNVSTISPDDLLFCKDIVPEVGITSTPVVDTWTMTVYVLVRTKEVVNDATVFFQRLHAVSLSTGKEVRPPTIVTGPPSGYAGTGAATFDPRMNNQRAALLLAHNQVYAAWASLCDVGQYTGWLMSFDEYTLQPTAFWTPVPYSTLGGIWISGNGPSVGEDGDIYVPVGNGGNHDLIGQNDNYRNSLVRLHWSATGGFSVVDYFAPFNYQMMDDEDVDFGSGAALLLPVQTDSPHPHLLVVRDKGGTVYLLDRDNLGKWQANDNSQIVQSFGIPGNGLSSGLFWNNTLYIAGGKDFLRAYTFDPVTQRFQATSRSYLDYAVDARAPTPSLSADGNRNAILWIITDYKDGKNAVLHAVDPSDISTEFYRSNMLPDRDMAGIGVKFVVPTIANGFVFVGAQNEVDMYGLLPPK